MKLVFEPAARDDIERFYEWISKDNPRAAIELIARVEAKVMLLASPALSRIGRAGMVEGTREILEPPYIIVYRIDETGDEIILVGILHGARDREGGEN